MATAKTSGDQYKFEGWSGSRGLISYPHVWEPRLNELNGKMQFQCSILIDKNGANLKEMSEAGIAVWTELSASRSSRSRKWANVLPVKMATKKDPDGPGAGHWIIHLSCSDKNVPSVVDKDNRRSAIIRRFMVARSERSGVQPMAYTTKFGEVNRASIPRA